MKESPILFSAPMVRAIMAGTKTQTRRLVKPQPPEECTHIGPVMGTYSGVSVPRWYWRTADDHKQAEELGKEYVYWPAGDDEESDGFTGDPYGPGGMECPYGTPENCLKKADRLWVREAWRAPLAYELTPPRDIPPGTPIVYQADGAGSLPHFNAGKLRPPMFMPRWASRITLEITAVRVERLQAISEADAQAEGCALECMTPTGDDSGSAIHGPGGYRALWESINGPGSWDANPWVWVVTFKRVQQP